MIVEKDSAILGYPNETSRALNANHHDVCKFTSPNDTNYHSVTSALRSLITSFQLSNGNEYEASSSEKPDTAREDRATFERTMQRIKHLLASQLTPAYDLTFFWNRWMPGTCEWILREEQLCDWVQNRSAANVLWLYAKPAKGKSILSSFLIRHLQEEGHSVQYHFFRFGDQQKRSIDFMLRSLAFQIAEVCPAYRKALSSLDEIGVQLKDSDWLYTWHQLFLSTLFSINDLQPLYWIVDGLDEAEVSSAFMELLRNLSASKPQIHVLLVSRWMAPIQFAFDKLSIGVTADSMCIDDAAADIPIYVEKELQYIPWASDITTRVAQRVTQQANGNFLWVHLALEEVKDCHTEEAVIIALQELPAGMEQLYQRMEDSIKRQKRPKDKALARQLLLWALYSRSPISIEEICHILEPEFGSLLNLKITLTHLCGHFIVLENGSHIALIHQTAREFLASSTRLPFSLEMTTAHDEIFRKSISVFFESSPGPRIGQALELKPLTYRATSWAFHLNRAISTELMDSQIDSLVKFFGDPGILYWIHALAVLNDLQNLIDVSKQLRCFIRMKRTTLPRRLPDLSLLLSWSRDLLKVVVKFGSHLIQDPTSIYSCVVPFCPIESIVHQNFNQLKSQSVSFQGVSRNWDDCIARVFIGSEQKARSIDCSSRYLAIVSQRGIITLWDRETLEELRSLDHCEDVSSICFNQKCDTLAATGRETLKIWNISSGQQLRCISLPHNTHGVDLKFTNDDSIIKMASNQSPLVMTAMLAKDEDIWQRSGTVLFTGPNYFAPMRSYRNCPTVLALSPDGAKVAAAYRGYPITIWQIEPAKLILEMTREGDDRSYPIGSNIVWHPNSQELLGIFLDSCIFKKNIVDDSYQELAEKGYPRIIQCSPDGKFFATSDMTGTIRLYDYELFTLVHCLSSEHMVSSICFDSSSRRLYDVRENYCNVWEPATLNRISEDNELLTEGLGESVSVPHSITAYDQSDNGIYGRDPASAMLRGTPLLCTLDRNGMVRIHDFQRSHITEMTNPRDTRAISINSSIDGRHFAISDDGNRINIYSMSRQLGSSSDAVWSHKLIQRFRIAPPKNNWAVQGLFLSQDMKLLVAIFRSAVQLWSLENNSLIATHVNEAPPKGHGWTMNALKSNQLLSFSPTSVTYFSWDSLEATHTVSFASEEIKSVETSTSTIEEVVEKAWNTYLEQYVLLNITRATKRDKLRRRFAIIECCYIDKSSTQSEDTCSAREVPIPADIAKSMEWPVNILKDGRLVFIDRQFWVCTWTFTSTSKQHDVVRHFFLPQDWITTENLQLSYITPEGKLLWLREGKVIVIESALSLGK